MILQTGHPPQGSKYVTLFYKDKAFLWVYRIEKYLQ